VRISSLASVLVSATVFTTMFVTANAAAAAEQGKDAIAASISSAAVPWTGTRRIHNPNSDRCLGIDSSGNAGVYDCTTNRDQAWTVASPLAGDYYLIVNSNNQCLNVSGGQGVRVRASLCNLTAEMGWRYYTDRYGRKVFENMRSHMILAVYGGLKANGSAVVQWADTNGADQAWGLT
jgi:hypothetical protein